MCKIWGIWHLQFVDLIITHKLFACFGVKYMKYSFCMWYIVDCQVNM